MVESGNRKGTGRLQINLMNVIIITPVYNF